MASYKACTLDNRAHLWVFNASFIFGLNLGCLMPHPLPLTITFIGKSLFSIKNLQILQLNVVQPSILQELCCLLR